MINKTILGILLLISGFLTACHTPREINVSQTLQQSVSSKIYTLANLWFIEDGEMTPVNYQKGTLLPFGTEVIIDKATEDEIFFHDVTTGKNFRIYYKTNRNIFPVEKFLQQYFGGHSRAQQERTLSAVGYEKAIRGVVTKDMTREEVIKAWGYPPTSHTPDMLNDTWTYLDAPFQIKRVIFKKNKVIEILTIE